MNKIFALCISALTSLFFTSEVFADGVQNYLMWQIPSSGVSLPVYVYQNGEQVAYIPSTSLQVFAGAYTPGVTNATYDLYYQSSGQWHGCAMVLSSGSVDPSTTCTGAVINQPVAQNGATSNVYTAGFGAIAWPVATTPPANPMPTDYSSRTITFKNNTAYPMIQIGESCNPKNATNSAPSCQNTPIIATISKDSTHVVTVGLNGLNSAAFYVSSFCTADSVAACGTPPTIAQCSSTPAPAPPANWVCTGGYFPGQTPYATKIEPTILAVTNGVPDGASNVDISAVDGYSMGIKFYPASSGYCTYTVPPENSNVLGAGYYSANAPFAQLVPTSSTSLDSLCANSSQLPAGVSGTPWILSKFSSTGAFEGCMSPCAYATANKGTNGITSNTVDQFCCTGNYNTPGSCEAAAGQLGANTSTYNTNIQNSLQFQHVYGFAYGDAGSDYACPPETNFVVEFVSGSTH